MAHVVTCFLREGADVLLTRRSDAVGTYRGRWAGVSGYVEGDPADAAADARRELREETGVADATLARAGDPLSLVDGDREWTVHPFLFEVPDRRIDPNEELAAVEWVQPTAIRDRETVPGLWDAYRRVGPTVETVRRDTEHGSAYVSVRALEVLRDVAAAADGWDAVAETGRALRDARPAMAAVATRVNAACHAVVAAGDPTPAAVRERAESAIRDALAADADAAAVAAELLARECGDEADDAAPLVATLSRSGTVLRALRAATPAVLVGESRPAREGIGVAETLAPDCAVTLATDAALPWLVAERDVDAVLVGADAVLADGSVVNKTGTRALALAAAREGVPTYAVAAAAKVRPDAEMHGEFGPPSDIYDGDAALDVANPTFDRTPADLVAAVVTEAGPLDAAAVARLAAEHRTAATWDD